MKKFLLIGNGHMGSAFVSKLVPHFKMTVASPQSRPSYQAKYYRDVRDIQNETFDYITFAIKPYVLPEIMKNLDKNIYHENT